MYRTIILRALAVTALPFLTAAAPPGTVQSYDSYKSWLVACDNTLSCVAKGFGDASPKRAQLSIERDAGPSGKVKASLSAEGPFAIADLRIDGQPAGLDSKFWVKGKDENALVTSSPSEVQALVMRLRAGKVLTLADETSIPLDGFVAAMLRLDDRQGRVGGVTALSKRGEAPASQVPPAPPLPRMPPHAITARLEPGEDKRLIADVRRTQKAVFAKEECEAKPGGMTAEAHALDATRALVLLPCLMGAYQGSSLAFIPDRKGGTSRRLVLQAPFLGDDRNKGEVTSFTEAVFDPATGTFATSAKGRGLGDCGYSASWIWDGKAFRLSQLAYQDACGGVSPGDWPTLYRSSP